MKTMTKAQLLAHFEDKEYVQINFPKVPTTARNWSGNIVEVEISDDTVLHMRSEVQNLDHFNTVYRDGNKYYLEETFKALERLQKRIEKAGGIATYEELEMCLYYGDYDMKEAKKWYFSHY